MRSTVEVENIHSQNRKTKLTVAGGRQTWQLRNSGAALPGDALRPGGIYASLVHARRCARIVSAPITWRLPQLPSSLALLTLVPVLCV